MSAGAPLQCMEVSGGNQTAHRRVEMFGLDAWVRARPFESGSGGDVHYLSSCGTGRIQRVLLADVSGHGEAVSRTADELRALMRQHVNTAEQSRFVRALNREFKLLAGRGQFATALAATFWAPTGDLELTNAGHPRPLMRRASEGVWRYLEGPAIPAGTIANLPLGVIGGSRYLSSAATLETGDLVLIYSDALIESERGDGEMLGEAGLLERVKLLDVSEPERFVDALIADLEQWRGGPPNDDETLLLLRPNRVRADHSLAGRARAALR
ncbi:MAG: serine/threonine-protein phosphatase, partial [Candidatus Eisenbacteria bacterium]|nr:serine/threonine-protein phosphatase [Candidatus Eisenbacteria bacterium]